MLIGIGPQTLGGLGTGALPPWAVPLYPGGPTPLTLPPFPFPPVPQQETELETSEELVTMEPEIELPIIDGDISLPAMTGEPFMNETHLNMTEISDVDLVPDTSAEDLTETEIKTEPTGDITDEKQDREETENETELVTEPTEEVTEAPLVEEETTAHGGEWIETVTEEGQLPVDQTAVEDHGFETHGYGHQEPEPPVEEPYYPPPPEEPYYPPSPVEEPYYPPAPEVLTQPPEVAQSVNFLGDNYEDTQSHCKGSGLTGVPENWNADQCARECMKREKCVGFVVDKSRNSEPHLCILKKEGCNNVGHHNVWNYYRKMRQLPVSEVPDYQPSSQPAYPPAPAPAPVDTGYDPGYASQYVSVDHAPEPVHSTETALSRFADTGEHCKGGTIDPNFMELDLEHCAKECMNNPNCGGFTWDKTVVSVGFKCLPKLASCEMSGTHNRWTFYRKVDNTPLESRAAPRVPVPAPYAPPVSDDSSRIFNQFFSAVDGNCEGTPIVSLPVPNKEACATECYNHPKCLGFSVQTMRDQPPLECQLNAQRCWHPHPDGHFRFFNRVEEMALPQGGAFGPEPGKFVVHEGMCLDQTGEFWVDDKAQCADRCLVDSNCQGYSFIEQGNMCRLIFSFDCNGAMIFRRLAEQFTTQRHSFPVEEPLHQTEARCNLPPDTGPCKANLRRWFFNSHQCEEFVFGGCEGNSNNFISLDECEQHCRTNGPPPRMPDPYQPAPAHVPHEPEPYIDPYQMIPMAPTDTGSQTLVGYKSLDGNCPGHVLQEVFQPVDVHGCAERCNAAPTCMGFAFAKDDAKCVLKDGPCNNPHPHKFIYYAKL